jgi:hypothetical protein
MRCFLHRARCETTKCRGLSIVLCSHPITRAGKAAQCNRHVCRTCAKVVGVGRAYCPPHGRLWEQGAAERKVLAEFFPPQKADR